ncbi:hypothetical protein HDU97_004550 [Phlyctochytrium planicorne]|nr:hypothetical protein HDU97_004550 [Phlyctochytrium planicorne]
MLLDDEFGKFRAIFSSLEATVKEKDIFIQEATACWKNLKEDFTYNLKLLDERDKELERYDELFEAIKTELSQNETEKRLKSDIWELTDGKKVLSNQLLEVEAKVQTLESEMKRNLLVAEEERTLMLNQLRESSLSHEKERQHFAGIIERLQKELEIAHAELKAGRDLHTEDVLALDQLVRGKEQEIAELKDLVSSHENTFKQMSENQKREIHQITDELKQKSEAYREELAKMMKLHNTTIAQLKEDVKVRDAGIQEMESKLGKQRIESVELKDELLKRIESERHLQNLLTERDLRYQEMSEEMKRRKDRESSALLSSLFSEKEKLEADTKLLRQQVEFLQSQSKTEQNSEEQHEAELQELKGHIEYLETENQNLVATVREMREDMEQTRQAIIATAVQKDDSTPAYFEDANSSSNQIKHLIEIIKTKQDIIDAMMTNSKMTPQIAESDRMRKANETELLDLKMENESLKSKLKQAVLDISGLAKERAKVIEISNTTKAMLRQCQRASVNVRSVSSQISLVDTVPTPATAPVQNLKRSISKPSPGKPANKTSKLSATNNFDPVALRRAELRTRGKITASNTWNLALIDYFHDMSFLKDGDSINFQKASCTLDGCVKIYMYRVDSVDAETKKLLSGLADRGRALVSGADGDEEGGDETDEAQAKEQTSKRKSTRTCETLEKDFASLNVKRLETEFMVDPLFKKTSADFDEGSASGLLLNHLSMSQTGKIIFDASDAEVGTLDGMEGDVSKTLPKLNIKSFRDKFLPSVQKSWNMEICPSLIKFTFNGNDMPDIEMFSRGSEEPESFSDVQDDGRSNTPFNDDYGGNFDNDDDGDGLPAFDEGADGPAERRMTFAESMATLDGTEDEEPSAFSYFDVSRIRSWAGPGYWKPMLRQKAKQAETVDKPKTRKEKVKVDLFAQQVNEKELFATTVVVDKEFWNQHSQDEVVFNSEPEAPGASGGFDNPDFHDDDDEIGELAGFDDLYGDSIQDSTPFERMTGTDPKNMYDFSYGDQLVDAPKKIKASFMHYARTPKRVDVKRLKENLWTNLHPIDVDAMEMKFTNVVSTLNSKYEEKDLKDISVAFCFICLLHLANEKNLSIRNDSLQDLTISVPETA